jgi:hypothetical protein
MLLLDTFEGKHDAVICKLRLKCSCSQRLGQKSLYIKRTSGLWFPAYTFLGFVPFLSLFTPILWALFMVGLIYSINQAIYQATRSVYFEQIHDLPNAVYQASQSVNSEHVHPTSTSHETYVVAIKRSTPLRIWTADGRSSIDVEILLSVKPFRLFFGLAVMWLLTTATKLGLTCDMWVFHTRATKGCHISCSETGTPPRQPRITAPSCQSLQSRLGIWLSFSDAYAKLPKCENIFFPHTTTGGERSLRVWEVYSRAALSRLNWSWMTFPCDYTSSSSSMS